MTHVGESFIYIFFSLQEEYQLVRDCLCGQMYDSSPVDFVSDLGTRFLLHPSVLKMSQPPRILSWMTRGIASGLDTLFIGKFEAQRAEYWDTLYSSVVCHSVLSVTCNLIVNGSVCGYLSKHWSIVLSACWSNTHILF